MKKEWYVVTTVTGYEYKVKEKLEMMINSMELHKNIYRVVVPEQKIVEVKDGVKKEKTKKMIVEDSVRFVEQKFKNLSSKKKFEKAKGYALELLTDKGITISDLELEILIESVCNNLNNKNSYKSSETAINEDVKEA